MKTPLEIVIATANRHKLEEILQIWDNVPWKIFSLKDFPHIPPIPETGSTFEENARIKAEAVFQRTGLITLADDSGLEVDFLDGAPGIFSARYAGKERDYAANNAMLLRQLKGVPRKKRGAQFRCVVFIRGKDINHAVEGIVRGHIGEELRGTHGFGYDPLFIPDGCQQTFAEMGSELKNQISHRAMAFKKAKEFLEKFLTNKLNSSQDTSD
ncbi:MAG: XTP/dITP diphosphatase [Calditrichia bacterium]